VAVEGLLTGWAHWSRPEETPTAQKVHLPVSVQLPVPAKLAVPVQLAVPVKLAVRWVESTWNPRFFATLWNLRGSTDPKIEEKSDNDKRFERSSPDYSTFGTLGKCCLCKGSFGPPQGSDPESKSNVFRCSFCLVGEWEQRYNPHPYELNIKSGSGEP
jgi:hypothetical protein